MTVRPILWTYKPRRDGSCNIKLYINSPQGKKYVATQLYAMPGDWDKRVGCFKRTAAHWRQLNAVLEQEQNKLLGQLLGADDSLLQFIADYIEECKQGVHNLVFNTWRQYPPHLAKLKAFCQAQGKEDLRFLEIDLQFYNEYVAHLRNIGLGTPGLDKQIKLLRKFLRLSHDRGLHNNRIFENPLFARIKYKAPIKIYLDEEEIRQLTELDCSGSILAREQDRFIVAYYLLLRHGDSVKISQDQFFTHSGRLFYRNQAEKTGTVSIVPVSSQALDILERRNYDLSGDTNQESNRMLKTLAAMANINSAYQGKPKWTYVTTHTARRSAATNLFLRGTPMNEIMQLGGWKEEKALKHYLLASGIELARKSGGRPFFD